MGNNLESAPFLEYLLVSMLSSSISDVLVFSHLCSACDGDVGQEEKGQFPWDNSE